jgi:methionyl-tRNA synthetase
MTVPSSRPEGGGQTYLVTMALPYANGDIHLGHLVEAVQTDVYVRYQRLRGNQAVYICADDTHGTPIELNALARGISPQALVAETYRRHVEDYAAFNIGFDLFYSTDSPENRHYAELIFGKLGEKGLVVEKEVEQYYCEIDKRFLPDRFIKGACPRCKAADQYGDVCEVCGATYDPADLAEPRCRLCSTRPVMRTSSHLFVDLKQCEGFLADYLRRPGVLQADMAGFVGNWLSEGLRQWCISRDAPYFGFEIPGHPGKYFYVWLDAPIGYLSSTAKWCADHGAALEKYWAAGSDTRVVHCIGKDIVYFHTLFWPVMLHSAGFNLPSRFFIHGFLTVQGEKMSKSRGTFILARTFRERVTHPQAAEYLRFYFAAKLGGGSGDLDLNAEEFCTRVNTTLANNIGNLHHRTFVFADRSFAGRIPDAAWDEGIAAQVEAAAADIAAAYENADYKSVIERVHALGSVGNKYYQDSKPWEFVKTEPARAASVIVTCANLVRSLVVFLKPIVPAIAAALEKQLGREFVWDDWRFGLRDVAAGVTVKLVAPIELSQFAAVFGESGVPGAAPADEGLIAIEDFAKVELRVGTITEAEAVQKSSKLLKLQVDVGGRKRQVVAGIAQHYKPEDLVGRQVVVVANLKPATLMGERSEGMVLAASKGKSLVLLQPGADIASGAKVS